MKYEVIAVDDSPPTLSDFKQAVSQEQNVALKTFDTEDEAIAEIKKFRKKDYLPIFFIDLSLSDNESGYRIVKCIRQKNSLRFVPIIIVSNSDDEEAVNTSYRLGANAYHVKGGDQTIESLVKYWLCNEQDKSVLHKRYI